jgi:CHAT domain-containing protein
MTALLPLFTATLGRMPVCATLDLTVTPSAASLVLSCTRSASAAGKAVVLVDTAQESDLTTLTTVLNEGEAIAATHATTPSLFPYVGEHSQGEDFVLEAISHADLVHLSCHGFVDADNPLRSWVHLGSRLELWRLWERQFTTAPTVVLSACHVGGSGPRRIGEQLGFPAVLLAAGAKCVIGALWAVPDSEHTAGLMTDFHHRLHAGRASNLALDAAIAMAAEQGTTPAVWAPCAHFGSP